MKTPSLESLTTDALDVTRRIVERFGPRLAGAESTHRAADAIATEMQMVCDSVTIEDFKVHPKAFMGWIRVMVVLYVLAVACLWMDQPIAAFVLTLAGLLLMVFEFFLYHEVIDALFPRKTGRNVCGVIEPAEEVRQQVIVSGHHDSAPIFNFFIYQPKLYALRVMGGIGSFVMIGVYSLVWSVFQLFSRAGGVAFPLVIIILNGLFTGLLLLVLQLWFFASSEGTPGAGDNLISTAIAVAVGKALKQEAAEGNPLAHTRVHLVSFDAEEAGLRGARRFFEAHAKEFTETPTWHYNMDCPFELDELFFLTSDINGSVPLSVNMAERCVSLAHEMGYPALHKPIAFLTGGTDAAEAAKVGIQAVTLMAMPWDNSERATVYHTPNDLPEAIDPKAVEAAIAIALGFIAQVDKDQSVG